MYIGTWVEFLVCMLSHRCTVLAWTDNEFLKGSLLQNLGNIFEFTQLPSQLVIAAATDVFDIWNHFGDYCCHMQQPVQRLWCNEFAIWCHQRCNIFLIFPASKNVDHSKATVMHGTLDLIVKPKLHTTCSYVVLLKSCVYAYFRLRKRRQRIFSNLVNFIHTWKLVLRVTVLVHK